ncbi:YqcI/YcgG family protein [Micromonospora sp. NPDC005215]|uniref:YqcI/YcgG family protein n=1 Tax=Micromonospora sp. NPDC005215 TaxID=3157024 RepID=UPI0033BA476A
MDNSNGEEILLTQEHTAERTKGWQRSAFDDLSFRLNDPEFPCIFSRNAFRKGIVNFIFVDSADEKGVRRLAEGLRRYVDRAVRWDGRLDTASPLVVAFAADAVQARTVEGYHAFGWRILNDLHNLDPAPWPDEVATEPDSPEWSMCFNGMPLFCNMSSPAHRKRRSRNLGAHFAIVINPRARFDVFAGDTPSGHKVRANIRDRIDRYDGTPHSPHLSSYGSGALEWLQYSLAEAADERADRCPFASGQHDTASLSGGHDHDPTRKDAS